MTEKNFIDFTQVKCKNIISYEDLPGFEDNTQHYSYIINIIQSFLNITNIDLSTGKQQSSLEYLRKYLKYDFKIFSGIYLTIYYKINTILANEKSNFFLVETIFLIFDDFISNFSRFLEFNDCDQIFSKIFDTLINLIIKQSIYEDKAKSIINKISIYCLNEDIVNKFLLIDDPKYTEICCLILNSFILNIPKPEFEYFFDWDKFFEKCLKVTENKNKQEYIAKLLIHIVDIFMSDTENLPNLNENTMKDLNLLIYLSKLN